MNANMEYTPEDLNKVRIKTRDGKGIHELPITVDILEVVPELKALDQFDTVFFAWGHTDDGRIIARNKIIRFINFMYSRELTCIKEQHNSYRAQKVECALLAGFEYDPVTGKFTEEVERMLMCLNPVVNRMIIAFCRHNYYDDEVAVTVMREMFYRGMNELMNNKDAEPEEINKWKKLSESIEEMKVKILNGDENRILSAALVKKIEEESLGFRPEDVAYRIKRGEDPLDGYDFYRDDVLG